MGVIGVAFGLGVDVEDGEVGLGEEGLELGDCVISVEFMGSGWIASVRFQVLSSAFF